MLSKEECQGMQHCNLERCIDSMWMLTTALLGSRLQGQACKRETALVSSREIVHTSAELVHSILDLHCAQSILAYRQHKKSTATPEKTHPIQVRTRNFSPTMSEKISSGRTFEKRSLRRTEFSSGF